MKTLILLIAKMFGIRKKQDSVVDKCNAELEELYTKELTMAAVEEWHNARAMQAESSVLRYAPESNPVKDGFYTLWQSALQDGNKVTRNRVIYTLSVEEELKLLLDEGKGAYQIINS